MLCKVNGNFETQIQLHTKVPLLWLKRKQPTDNIFGGIFPHSPLSQMQLWKTSWCLYFCNRSTQKNKATNAEMARGIWKEMLTTNALTAELFSVWDAPASKTNKGGSISRHSCNTIPFKQTQLETRIKSIQFSYPPNYSRVLGSHLLKWQSILGCFSCPNDDGQHCLPKE